jgi:eukaryotic translation initiation factor 2C
MTKLADHETRIDVDLAAEDGKKPSDRSKGTVFLKQTKELKFDILSGYLQHQHTWDRNTAAQFLECMSFLDHLLRELPSQNYTQIKKSFFQRGQKRFMLSPGVEAMKGAFASMRIVNNFPNGALLSVNVDVANGTFFTQMDLFDHFKALLGAKDLADVQRMFRNAKNERGPDGKPRAFKHTDFFKELKVLHKLKVEGKHRQADYTIKRIVDKDCTEHRFEKDGKQISVQDYFRTTYNVAIKPGVPLIETNKGEFLPVEALKVPENQRFPFRLNPQQTSNVSYHYLF